MEETKSDLWVRERATIKDNPALASHADKVKSIRLFDKSIFFDSLRAIRTNPINKDIKRSSKHKSIDKKCSRLRSMPKIPR